MKGGLIEGIKKIFKSPDSLKFNSILLVLTIIISAIASLVYFHIPPEVLDAGGSAVDRAFYHYLFMEKPLMGIIMLLLSFVIGAYMMCVTNNAIKISTAYLNGDESAANANILPEITVSSILKPMWGMIAVSFVWAIYILLTFLILGLSALLLKRPSILILLGFVMGIILPALMPMVWTKFADKFEIKPLLNPLIAATIIQKTFLSAWWLLIRYTGLVILMVIAFILIMLILAICLGPEKQDLIIFVITSAMMYFAMIFAYAFYYSLAFIYSKKLKQDD